MHDLDKKGCLSRIAPILYTHKKLVPSLQEKQWCILHCLPHTQKNQPVSNFWSPSIEIQPQSWSLDLTFCGLVIVDQFLNSQTTDVLHRYALYKLGLHWPNLITWTKLGSQNTTTKLPLKNVLPIVTWTSAASTYKHQENFILFPDSPAHPIIVLMKKINILLSYRIPHQEHIDVTE